MPNEWFKELFDDSYLEVYGLGLDRTPAEVDFITNVLALPQGSSILDLACGHGRHAVELARRGHEVVGLDLSRTLLDKAAELAAEAGVRLELVEEDMRAIPETWTARFDAVINVFTSWGYFDNDEENERVVEAITRSLKLGGRFFLDYLNRERIVREFRSDCWQERAGGLLTFDKTQLDLRRGRIETQRLIVRPEGNRFTQRMSVRLFTLAEICAMFERCGLTVRETYGDWEGGEYSIESRRMMVLAERER